MQQNILLSLIFVVEGDRRKFVYDENFPIYGSVYMMYKKRHMAGVAFGDLWLKWNTHEIFLAI